MSKKISIHSVLAAIKTTIDPTKSEAVFFKIEARYKKGPKKGQVYFKAKCRRHLSGVYRETHAIKKREGIFESNKEKGIIMLYDEILNHPFNVPYYLLISFNGQTITHE